MTDKRIITIVLKQIAVWLIIFSIFIIVCGCFFPSRYGNNKLRLAGNYSFQDIINTYYRDDSSFNAKDESAFLYRPVVRQSLTSEDDYLTKDESYEFIQSLMTDDKYKSLSNFEIFTHSIFNLPKSGYVGYFNIFKEIAKSIPTIPSSSESEYIDEEDCIKNNSYLIKFSPVTDAKLEGANSENEYSIEATKDRYYYSSESFNGKKTYENITSCSVYIHGDTTYLVVGQRLGTSGQRLDLYTGQRLYTSNSIKLKESLLKQCGFDSAYYLPSNISSMLDWYHAFCPIFYNMRLGYYDFLLIVGLFWLILSTIFYKKEIKKFVNFISNKIDSISSKSKTKNDKSINKRKTKVLISHSGNDREYSKALTDLLEDIKIESVVCSSVPEKGVPLGYDIDDFLLEQFNDFDLHLILMFSENYFNSTYCQQEMGAAWAKKKKSDIVLLPGYDYSDIPDGLGKKQGQIGIKLDSDLQELKHRLDQFKDDLIKEFGVEDISPSKWERKRDEFIEKINQISLNKKSNN